MVAALHVDSFSKQCWQLTVFDLILMLHSHQVYFSSFVSSLHSFVFTETSFFPLDLATCFLIHLVTVFLRGMNKNQMLRWQTRKNWLYRHRLKRIRRLEGMKWLQQIKGEVKQTHDKLTQKEPNKDKPLKGDTSFVNKVTYIRERSQRRDKTTCREADRSWDKRQGLFKSHWISYCVTSWAVKASSCLFIYKIKFRN